MENREQKEERYGKNLSQMLQAETVSLSDKGEGYGKFYEFIDLLGRLFPHLFAVCEREDWCGNLLLRWRGKTDGTPCLFMNHFDVVPAQQQGWKYPPFCGEVHEGKLWGRGALDTKGGLWAMLQAGDDLAKTGFQPNCDIYFESSCTEETTFEGASHFYEELKKRGVRFSFVLDEGGMIMYEPLEGVKGTYAMVGLGERGCAELRFTAKGIGGHASSPEYDTPMVRIGRFMAEADRTKTFRAELSPVICEMFRRMSEKTSGPLKFIYAHPKLFSPILKKVMPKTSGTAKALLQTTIAFTVIKGGAELHVIPNEVTVCASMRVSHHQKFQDSLRAVTEIADKYGIETEVLDPAVESPLSDYQSDAFRQLEDAVKEAYPGVMVSPYIMTGCSDARFFANLTENCYHFVPFLISQAQLESIHGRNECVDVSTLVPAVHFYQILMQKG